jgi:hypothetical protein
MTANRLSDGEVVFWKAGTWVDGFGEAELFDVDGAVEGVVAIGKAQPTVVVDVYPIDLVEADGRWAPVSYRERMRALGPTNEPTHGKQAEGGAVIEALRHASRRRPIDRPCRPDPQEIEHVPYDAIDREFLADRSNEFRQPGGPPPGRRADRGPVQAAAADERPLSATARLHAAGRHSLWLAQRRQLRRLAGIARTYDKGYGHITTRQNIQFNWIKLKTRRHPGRPGRGRPACDPDQRQLHPQRHLRSSMPAPPPTRSRIRASGARCSASGRPSIPNSAYLPRKFKIAVTGSLTDRAAVKVHDIGLILRKGRDGEIGFEVMVGGGQGRTPYVGPTIKQFLPAERLLSYVEAILRVYNRHGRRDNIYKARIKILVAALGARSSPARSRTSGPRSTPPAPTCRRPSWPASAPPSPGHRSRPCRPARKPSRRPAARSGPGKVRPQ